MMKGSDSNQLFKKILVGLDISDQTDALIEIAFNLAKELGAEVDVVTVINVPTNSPVNEMDGTPANNDEIRLRDELFARLHKHLQDSNGAKSLEVKVLHGDPAERIAEYAEYTNCDLVVVGSRRRGALRKAILGSVSGSVAAKSKRSVLIVKE